MPIFFWKCHYFIVILQAKTKRTRNIEAEKMTKRFAEHKGLNLIETNEQVLAYWEKNDVFHKSINEREGYPQFVFFEGPPSANGHPGIHHVMGRTIKDTILRYKTMKGYQVHRKAGWDTHGLPVELSEEK